MVSYFNPYFYLPARMAVGLTVDLALSVAANELRNGFALVRPPGHHAEKDLAMYVTYTNLYTRLLSFFTLLWTGD